MGRWMLAAALASGKEGRLKRTLQGQGNSATRTELKEPRLSVQFNSFEVRCRNSLSWRHTILSSDHGALAPTLAMNGSETASLFTYER